MPQRPTKSPEAASAIAKATPDGRPDEAKHSFKESQDDYDRAESLFSQLVAHPGLNDAQNEECRVFMARTYLNRGVLLRLQLDKASLDQELFENATQAYLKAIDQLKTVIEENRLRGRTERLEYELDLAKYYNNLANLLFDFQVADPQGEAAHYNDVAVQLAKKLNVGTPAVRKELANFYRTKGELLESSEQTEQAISAWENAADVLETVWRQNQADDGVTEVLGRHLCNICFYYQKLDKHSQAIKAIDRLALLNCNRTRFETAAKYMETGRKTMQDRDPAIAEQYQQRFRTFQEKAQAAK
jgi:tetratricopeptide (TPR) repeat protein